MSFYSDAFRPSNRPSSGSNYWCVLTSIWFIKFDDELLKASLNQMDMFIFNKFNFMFLYA